MKSHHHVFFFVFFLWKRCLSFFLFLNNSFDFLGPSTSQVACMQLINALVTSPDDLDFRIHLRNEFLRCGLKKILPVSCSAISQHTATIVAQNTNFFILFKKQNEIKALLLTVWRRYFYLCESVIFRHSQWASWFFNLSRISFTSCSLCRVWCSACTSLHRLSWHHYQQAYTSSHGAKAFELQLITQALICSKWGEHVTEPVVNKSSQLLLLIITVITLIIFNSAPWYEHVSVYSHLWMPRSRVFF